MLTKAYNLQNVSILPSQHLQERLESVPLSPASRPLLLLTPLDVKSPRQTLWALRCATCLRARPRTAGSKIPKVGFVQDLVGAKALAGTYAA